MLTHIVAEHRDTRVNCSEQEVTFLQVSVCVANDIDPHGLVMSGRKRRTGASVDPLPVVAVGEAVCVGVDGGGDGRGLLPGEEVAVADAGGDVAVAEGALALDVGVAVRVGVGVAGGDVAVAEGALALDVGVAVRVGVGVAGGDPPNGVSVTYTGPAGEPPKRRSPGLPPPAASVIVVPLPSSNRYSATVEPSTACGVAGRVKAPV